VKPTAFDFERPDALPAALELLAEPAASVPLSGGQSLLVLLRLRLTAPERLVDVARLPELIGATRSAGVMRIGAATTHAAIEDGLVPDTTLGLMRHAASGIAYRAVRNLGTIGGSLALADPSADWPVCLLALDASVRLHGPAGERRVKIDDFLISAFTTALVPGEILTAVQVPDLPEGSRWGYAKLARKHGAFADSLAAAVWPSGGTPRVVLGATTTRPALLRRTQQALVTRQALATQQAGAERTAAIEAAMAEDVAEADPDADAYRRRCHLATVRRAVRQMEPLRQAEPS
jgi:carbon-monoxide dehydrogenase medium subunit